ncbi:MAG: hypothetical protein DI536_05080 [Archangium gephyra]|uniref:Metallo-beta-lactamase domain-containing protein n=1 Tax=Archangium gephyra TaxID=48 RepID=A0A2W5TWK5_9BACT|nr:MAG: hypothetical protein DI536_05080 [Archangium gephyra]
MKRKLLIAVGVVVALLVIAGASIASAFAGLVPVPATAELGEGVTSVADGYVQAYIVPIGEGSAILIDCGQDPAGTAIKAQLAEKKLTVKAALITHGHADHTNGCAAFPGIEIASLENEKPVIEGLVAARGPVPKLLKNDPAKSPKVTRVLRDGDTLGFGEAVVQVFSMPGHTAGSAAYLTRGVLFVGDAASGVEGGTVRIAPWAFNDDGAQARESIEAMRKRLLDVKVRTVAFSHTGSLPSL